jgi:tubulin polyglutamylase TTLL9
LKKRGWKECEDETNWDIYWAEKEWIHDVMD